MVTVRNTFFLLLLCCFSCSKEVTEPAELTLVLGEKTSLYSVFQQIENPMPVFDQKKYTLYQFDFNHDNFSDLFIRFNRSETIYQSSIKTVSIEIDTDKVISTNESCKIFEYHSKEYQPERFITYSEYSSVSGTPTSSYNYTLVYPKMYSGGQHINLLDKSLNWKLTDDCKLYTSGAFIYQQHRALYANIFEDYLFPMWQNTAHKYVIFQWFDHNTKGYKYGYIELSLSEKLELSIHNVYYQF